MTATIMKLTGAEAYDLIYPEHLAILSEIDQETMKRTMTNSSHVWMGFDGMAALALWGLIPPTLLSDRAYLWLYTTKHLRGHEFVLVRHSQRAVAEMLTQFPLIVGNTMADNLQGIRWLKWLGAQFFDSPTPGVLYFEIKQSWHQQSAQSA